MANALRPPNATYDQQVSALRCNDPTHRSNKFALRCNDAVAECNAKGFDVVSFETSRVEALQALYYQHGTSRVEHANRGWHFYWLADDFISNSRQWDVYPNADGAGGDPAWYGGVHDIFKLHGLDAGSDWTHFRDWPHWQFGGMSANPQAAIGIYQDVIDQGGTEEDARLAVWQAVGAI